MNASNKAVAPLGIGARVLAMAMSVLLVASTVLPAPLAFATGDSAGQPDSASGSEPAATPKVGNLDKWIGLGKSQWVIGVTRKKTKVYKTADRKKPFSKKYFVDKKCCVVINKKYLNSLAKGEDHYWLRIDMTCTNAKLKKYQKKLLKKRGGQEIAWVNVKDLGYLDAIDTKKFGMKNTKGKNKVRKKVLTYALDHLGIYFWSSHDDLKKGMDCASFVTQSLRQGGLHKKVNRWWAAWYMERKGKKVSRSKLKPGDTVFWRKKGSKVATHSAIYLGKGTATGTKYVVMCSGPRHNYYPRAGSRIARLDFRGFSGQKVCRNIIGG